MVFPVLTSKRKMFPSRDARYCDVEAIVTSARNGAQIAHFKAAIFEPDPKPDLAAVGHGLELPAFFP